MPIVKSSIMTEEAGAINIQTQAGADVGGSTATFSKTKAGIVLKSRSRPVATNTPAQLWQRQLYKDADCLWKNMTTGQRNLWYEFNTRHPERQEAAASDAGVITLWEKQHVSKLLSARQKFMKMALKFNLEPFLSAWLGSEMQIYDLVWEADHLTATIKIVKKQEEEAPSPYEAEADIFRMRRW